MEQAHHDFGPSTMGRRAACLASYQREKQAEKEGVAIETYAAEAAEGTDLHTYLDPAKPIDALTPEQQRLVLKARTFVIERAPASGDLLYEHRLDLLDDGMPLIFGTADLVAVSADGEEDVIFDFKFGRGELWQESLWWQFAGYAGAYLQAALARKVKCHALHVSSGERFEVTFTLDDVTDIIHRWKAVMAAANEPNPPASPSPNACRFCKAKVICPEFQAATGAVVKTDPQMLPVASLKRYLSWRPMLRAFDRAVDKHLKTLEDAALRLLGYERRKRRAQRMSGTGEYYEVEYLRALKDDEDD